MNTMNTGGTGGEADATRRRGAELLAERLRRRAGAPPPRRFERVNRSGDLPVTPAQRRLWVLDRMRPGGTEYLVPLALRLIGNLGSVDLAGAVSGLVRRHEVLRTRYVVDTFDEVVARIDRPAPVPLPVTDLTEDADSGRAVEQILREETSRPIDLATGPLVRARLLRLGSEEHVLVLILHHIAVDGWSAALLVSELAELAQGHELAVSELQYVDVATGAADPPSAGLTFWIDELTGMPALALPTDRPRPVLWQAEGATVSFELPGGTAGQVARLASETHGTPFMVYLAACWALLHRYTGQEDFGVATPVAARTAPEVQDLVGLFVNTIVLRADLTGSPTFAQLVERARRVALNAYEHQDVGFEHVVDALAPHRDLSGHPLTGVNLTLQNNKPVRFAAGAVQGEMLPVEAHQAKFDLGWTLEERTDGSVACEVTFPHSVWDESTVRSMADHFTRLIDSALADPQRRVVDLDILSPAEIGTATPGPAGVAGSEPTLPQRFAQRVRAHSNAPALTGTGANGEQCTLSYAELDARANQMAGSLRERGVDRGELVALYLPRGIDFVVCMLAVLKAGAAYLPLEPTHPNERTGMILADACPRLLVTDGLGVAALSGVNGPYEMLVLDKERDAACVATSAANQLDTPVDTLDLAYVIYTSGSTGRPKGVEVTHANVVRLLTATEDDYGFGPEDVWACLASYAFDFSVWEIWGALLHGGRLVMVAHETARSPWELATVLADEGVTVLNQTPSAFGNLMELIDDPILDRLRLRVVVFGGEKLDVGILEPWWRRYGQDRTRMVNMYGITETTVHVTSHTVTPADLTGERSSIGRPIRDLTLHVLDARMRPIPTGVTGEIHVGGPGVTRGYLHRPALTADRFRPDPFGPPGSRVYRSGDLARMRPSGNIDFVGRSDNQVKIRGYRIELDEIEARLSAHPDVVTAVVTAYENADGHRELLAHAVVRDGGAPVDKLRMYLTESLPSYMVPGRMAVVSSLPLTPNGKVDRAMLPELKWDDRETVHVAPRTGTERALAQTWGEVLGQEAVGVHDNFFTAGGDSIRAVRLVGRLRRAGLNYSVEDLFRYQTIAELTAARPDASGTGLRVGTAPFSLLSDSDRAALPNQLDDAYPMTRVQSGMVFEMLADPKRARYHNVTSYLIRDTDPLDAAALRIAVADLVAAHEILRTSFNLVAFSGPTQLVHRTVDTLVEVEDLPPNEGADEQMSAFRDTERARLFDLASAPLVRFHGHRCAEGRWYLTLTECHAVLDGWSHNSLITELIARYRAVRDRRPHVADPAPGARFADYVALEQASLTDGISRAFWTEHLNGVSRLTVPQAWADLEGCGQYALRVPYAPHERGLREIARRAGASLKSVLLAAHIAVWQTIAGGERFHFGLVAHGRPEVDGGDRVRGMFLNTIPVVAPAVRGSWCDLVREVFAEEIDTWAHRRYPMPQLQHDIGGGERMIDVAFNYLDFHILDREAVDTEGSTDVGFTEFPFCALTEAGDLVLVTYSEYIGRRHGELLAAMYARAFELMASDPDSDCRTTLLPIDERNRLAVTGARVTVRPGPSPGVHEAVGKHSATRPNAIAVATAEGTMTYRELHQRAGAWAAHLRSEGVRPGDLVGVHLPRDRELVAVIVGIVGLGATYVPVEPHNPAERNSAILRRSGVRVVAGSPVTEDDPFTVLPPIRVTDVDEHFVPRVSHPEELVCIVHTSGSSGQPKGVMLRQQALADRIEALKADLTLVHDDVLVSVVPITTDVWQMDLFLSLASGARLVLAGEDDARDPVSLSNLLRSTEATIMMAAATTWQLLDETGWAPPPGFRRISGGERIGAELTARMAASEVGVWDAYGPSEATGYCFNSTYGAGMEPGWLPATHTPCYLLGPDLDPVLDGVPGQVFVGGDGLARGYLNQSGATATAFVPDPFAGTPGARMYATGDLGRRTSDGRIEILGRRDHQLKIRGFRVEVGEVEAALIQHPDVTAAVVHSVPGPGGNPRLAGYVVVASPELQNHELVRFLRERLPHYMVPTFLQTLEALPVLPNGKVDRSALPVPDVEQPAADVEYAEPNGSRERAIAAVWEEVLEVGQVGRHDDFYALGGNSLLAMRIIALLSSHYSITLGFRDFFVHRTVAATATASGSSSSLVWLGSSGIGSPLFCIHPGGGSAHWYRGLAEQYASKRPVAAFEWPGLNGDAPAPPSLAAAAEVYVDDLLAEYPIGPHHLLGWCGSSGIAWEMSRRLGELGHSPHLVLIDPIEYPSTGMNPLEGNVRVLRRSEQLLAALNGAAPGAERDDVRAELSAALRTMVDDGDTVFTGDDLETELIHDWARRLRSWREMAELRLTYRFEPLAEKVDILVCQELADGAYAEIVGEPIDRYLARWRALTHGGFDHRLIPGDHTTALFQPHVAQLATVLDELTKQFYEGG
ncbi:amino acid adenylation domain-containing protein [Rhodococcus qingshengii]|uniref:amino acid adenylation domain-containing protein n=1 Tax=Rhodococcus qingshengii TaxID=334542 RepID=UPI0036DBD2A3